MSDSDSDSDSNQPVSDVEQDEPKSRGDVKAKTDKKAKLKRENKNRPIELSAKKRVDPFWDAVGGTKKVGGDDASDV